MWTAASILSDLPTLPASPTRAVPDENHPGQMVHFHPEPF
jgi:hypothetical protein